MIEMDAKTQISEDKGSQTNFIINSSAAFSAMIEFPSIYRIRSDANICMILHEPTFAFLPRHGQHRNIIYFHRILSIT